MRLSAPTVAGNLAIDEEMGREAGITGRRVLRLWWGSGPTAVLGCADKPEKSLDLDECARLGVGWVKRVSGGGTVLQTPGVLNYSYTAPACGRVDMQQVFSQGADMIVDVLSGFGVIARQRGISDVAVGDLKISGNAQARKRKAVLLHGTLMVDIDRKLMSSILRYPDKEPDYRNGRTHSNFVTSLNDLGVIVNKSQLEDVFALAAVKVFG